jgi:VID27 C-terminal WD40-like domain
VGSKFSGSSINKVAANSESYDEDEDYDTTNQIAYTDAKNSALAVGYKSDRSFVIRGDKIGVFKHTQDDGLGRES